MTNVTWDNALRQCVDSTRRTVLEMAGGMPAKVLVLPRRWHCSSGANLQRAEQMVLSVNGRIQSRDLTDGEIVAVTLMAMRMGRVSAT